MNHDDFMAREVANIPSQRVKLHKEREQKE
jgi:hypothetical protein